MAQDIAQMTDDGRESEPLSALEKLIEQAHRLEVDEEQPVGTQEPMERLEALIDRARWAAQGEGGRALRRLQDRIERARWIPDSAPYQPPEGDPIEALKARVRGEEPDQRQAAVSQKRQPGEMPAEERGTDGNVGQVTQREATASESPAAGGGGRHQQLGEALEASLRGRALPGPVRAEVAARLAAMLEEHDSAQLREIWELVVFEGRQQ